MKDKDCILSVHLRNDDPSVDIQGAASHTTKHVASQTQTGITCSLVSVLVSVLASVSVSIPALAWTSNSAPVPYLH